MNFELDYKAAKEAKKIADKNLAIAKFKYELDKALQKAKLLAPDTRRRIVSNMDLGYLIQAHNSVCSNDWSAYADGTVFDILALQTIGNAFLSAYNKITVK